MNDNSFQHKKAFGQNFLSDSNLLSAIVRDAGVGVEDTVIEIGAGAGALTAELVKVARRVIAYEIDKRLEPVLRDRFGNCDGLELVFSDIMQEDIGRITEGLPEYKLVANLPYYITTPILFKFIEHTCIPTAITVMVQSEVADRLVARPSTKDYGALSVGVQSLYDVRIARKVSRQMFTPPPNVDSAIVVMTKREVNVNPLLRKCVRAAFSMRRKTLINNLLPVFGLDRGALEAVLDSLNLPRDVRGEALSVEEFAALASLLSKRTD